MGGVGSDMVETYEQIVIIICHDFSSSMGIIPIDDKTNLAFNGPVLWFTIMLETPSGASEKVRLGMN